MANVTKAGTIVGYDYFTGKELFREANRVTSNPDQTYALPRAGDYYLTSYGRNYFIVGIRATSIETLWEMDVLEELPSEEPDRTGQELAARRIHSIVELNLLLQKVKILIQFVMDRLNQTTDEQERRRLGTILRQLEAKRDALTKEIKRLGNKRSQP